MRIAVIADIHGNYPALEAVLADITVQEVDEVIVAGDAINAAPFPREVMDTIHQQQWRMVLGNHEQYMLDCRDPECDEYPRDSWLSFHWTADHMTDADLDFFRNLPESIAVTDDLIIMHGSPGRVNWGVLPSTPDRYLEEQYGKLPHHYIVTAHTHVPQVIHWRDKTIINPGSVGMSFDGNTAASYMILTQVENRFIIQNRRVNYDVELVVKAAQERGFLDTDIFAANFITQITHAYPQSRSLIQHITELQEQGGLSIIEAIAQADFSQVTPDYDYTFPFRKPRITPTSEPNPKGGQ